MRWNLLIAVCLIRLFTQMFWELLPNGATVYYAGQSLLETVALFLFMVCITRKNYVQYVTVLFFAVLSAFDFIKIVFIDPFSFSVWQYTGLIASLGIVVIIEILTSIKR